MKKAYAKTVLETLPLLTTGGTAVCQFAPRVLRLREAMRLLQRGAYVTNRERERHAVRP